MQGGGAFILGSATFITCNIRNNEAGGTGGGLSVFGTNPWRRQASHGTIRLFDTAFSDNKATGAGCALAITSAASDSTLYNVTFLQSPEV